MKAALHRHLTQAGRILVVAALVVLAGVALCSLVMTPNCYGFAGECR